MGLVSTWLRGIGLAYAIPSFRSRHITTPQKLSLLTLADYDALGVKEVGDRKKLFYLVQRIRMAVKEGEMAGKGGEGDNGGESCDGNDTGNDKSEDTAKDTAKDASNNCDDNNDDESSSSADLPPAVSCHDMDSVDLIADDTENDLVNVAENDPLPTTATATSKQQPKLTKSPLKKKIRKKYSAPVNENDQPSNPPNIKSPPRNKRQLRQRVKPASVHGVEVAGVPASAADSPAPAPAPVTASTLPPNALHRDDTANVNNNNSNDNSSSNDNDNDNNDINDNNDNNDYNSDSSTSFVNLTTTQHAISIAENTMNTTNSSNNSITYQQSPSRQFNNNNDDKNAWENLIGDARDVVDEANHATKPSTSNEFEDMRIRVVVRKRPLSKSEERKGEIDIIQQSNENCVVHQPKVRVDLTREVESQMFRFDNVFEEDICNDEIYAKTVKGMINGVFLGGKASVFAYGQTGSGKTFTMMGSSMTGHNAGGCRDSFDANDPHNKKNSGLYLKAANDVFQHAQQEQYKHLTVTASLFEIYGGKLFDLLNSRKLVKCLEDAKQKVCFLGLSEHVVTSSRQLMNIIETGANNRSTGTTSANADSSRSHAVLQLSIKAPTNARTRRSSSRNNNYVEHGRLSFIDLAGSERGADTNKCDRQTRLEGAEINTSLLALKEVIRALSTGDTMQHIPFRGSKLTQVLKDSFIGENTRSVMIACVAPNLSNCEHTLNTLRYADRVKDRDPDTSTNNDRRHLDNGYGSGYTTSNGNNSDRPVTAPAQQTRRSSGNGNGNGNGNGAMPATRRSLDSGGRLSEIFNNNRKSLEFDDRRSDAEKNAIAGSKIRGSMRRRSLGGGNVKPTGPATNNASNYIATTTASNNNHNSSSSNNYNNIQPPPPPPPEPPQQATTKKQTVKTLVDTHRSVMTIMLGMVKREMALVNDADRDRDTIETYLDDLESMQVKKTKLIDNLRELVKDYKVAKVEK